MSKPRKGDYFYMVCPDVTLLKKITWLKNGLFEFNMGWSETKKLLQNPNNKSKVKYILEYK